MKGYPRQARGCGTVRHKAWGEGEVLRVEGEVLTLLFDSVGYKTLALKTVLENKLLESAG